MGLYHPLDGDTNLKDKLLCFLKPNKKNSKRKTLAFNWDRCCHLALRLQLILIHWPHSNPLAYYTKVYKNVPEIRESLLKGKTQYI